MHDDESKWLLLIASLPTSGATIRMRLWRGIKGLGCIALRDGAYLLVDCQEHADALAEFATQINREGGQAWVLDVVPRSESDNQAYQALFDCSSKHVEIVPGLTQARKALPPQTPAEITKTLKRLRKERDAILRNNFFSNQASLDAEAAWADFEEAATAIQVSLNGKSCIETSDSHILDAGRVGVWTKADSVTLFDDFAYDSLAKQ
ncbi:Chromate resistance protein ChrB [Noviherbaspirillum malthae]|uniref:Chromate resistance protein ChrB n=1 Tax=Noviherbaspirillum malthae TaxID=1260987 RepID=UPI00188FEA22|nr:Chromate resistance protein ChrB [Noviherbaspirillum malthae]